MSNPSRLKISAWVLQLPRCSESCATPSGIQLRVHREGLLALYPNRPLLVVDHIGLVIRDINGASFGSPLAPSARRKLCQANHGDQFLHSPPFRGLRLPRRWNLTATLSRRQTIDVEIRNRRRQWGTTSGVSAQCEVVVVGELRAKNQRCSMTRGPQFSGLEP